MALEREIEELEGRLTPGPVVDELVSIRRRLGSGRGPGAELPNLRIGFACKERWDGMVGDDRVRACGGCARPVFNLSAMTRDEAEALLATRGLKPCVRFYRRPDGTVMTTDCPTSTRRAGRSLAVIAAGATLSAASPALADDTPTETTDAPPEEPAKEVVVLDHDYIMGLPPPSRDFTEKRPAIEWSVWGRLGVGVATESPDAVARRVTTTSPASISTWSWLAALSSDFSVGVARGGDLRLGAWGEIRTSSGPVAGGELVLDRLTPHSYTSRIGRAGSIVLRAGGNARVITAAFGVGYVGTFPRFDPWVRWARHVVGARTILSFDRSRDDPHDWSATIGLEIEPIGALHGLYDIVTGR
jgi:hypothetical protein